MEESSKFGVETKENDSLLFLDILVNYSKGGINTSVTGRVNKPTKAIHYRMQDK